MLGALLIFPLEAISMSLSFVLAWLMNRSGSILVSGSRT
jgi:hypothetical protein